MRRAQAFNLHRRKIDEKYSIEAPSPMTCSAARDCNRATRADHLERNDSTLVTPRPRDHAARRRNVKENMQLKRHRAARREQHSSLAFMSQIQRAQPNARHHPPAHKIVIDDRQRVAGRVHAVVRRSPYN